MMKINLISLGLIHEFHRSRKFVKRGFKFDLEIIIIILYLKVSVCNHPKSYRKLSFFGLMVGFGVRRFRMSFFAPSNKIKNKNQY